MFRRDPELKTRIDRLITDCRLDPGADLESLIIAIKAGPPAAAPSKTAEEPAVEPAVEPALMVATGRFVEADLASCVGQRMAADGGGLTARRVEGRAVYHASGHASGHAAGPAGRDDSVWFTISGPRTLLVATSSDWLAKALGRGDKIAAAPTWAALLKNVDLKADLWAVGQLDQRVGAGLVELGAGALKSPPGSLFVQADLSAGVRFLLGAVMTSAGDANALVSLIKSQLAWGALAVQRYGLGPLVSKLGVDSEDKTVYLRMTLSEDEVKDVLARIDTPGGATQNSAEN
jgi:hypothetical protein